MLKIAFIDIIGLTYDGETLSKRGLGGSESAVILMAKELVKLGLSVTVYNNCNDNDCQQGIYDGVEYRYIYDINKYDDIYDILISSRTVIPFVPEKYWNSFNPNPSIFSHVVKNAKFKAVWMHDTFCSGDQLLEEFLVEGHIDEIFTLSDFHTTYVTNCAHGNKRNFEVLKNKVFMTRNGIVKHINEVNIADKDRDLFVYNASVTKGMLPLVKNIWPEIKKHIPNAKLKVIGGYYRFKSDGEPDEQEKTWRQLVADPYYENMGIEFTGIIKQSEIANILSRASFMLYPAAFPETFGISSLESLCYNTPLITCRFGALEETAIDGACYLINYAIEPNGLFPHIDSKRQELVFVDETIKAYNNYYLYQQKANYCNIIKDICTWDTVALQWKQHFYKKLNQFLPVQEYKKVSKINHRVQKVFGRRFTNPEQMYPPSSYGQLWIKVISPFYNAADYIEKCILSVAQQDYENYIHYLVDDASTDDGYEIAKKTIDSLPESIKYKFVLIKNEQNMGAVYNQVNAMKSNFCDAHDIIMLLDGDDWLVNDNTIFQQYNQMYKDDGVQFSYGSCWSIVDNIPLIAQEYPEDVKQNKTYRQHKFNWNMPYTHLRTFIYYLFKQVSEDAFKDEDGNWLKAGGDGAIFYNVLEQADPDRIKVVQDIVCNYNDASPLNDYKINGEEQTKTAEYILRQNISTKTEKKIEKKEHRMQHILIAIPTAKYIETETFKSIFDLQVPDGFKIHFQYFYGYQIDQVRNLIADWMVNGPYDYLFSVDSDIVLPQDSLVKMLNHDKDMVSGVYIQRKHDVQIPEIYRCNAYGGVTNIDINDIPANSLISIDGCGFGCVLIKKHVFTSIQYPHFVYHSAIDHRNTLSEDVDFCNKVRAKGFTMFADTSILCNHIGSHHFKPTISYIKKDLVENRLRNLSNQRLLPQQHIDYLWAMKTEQAVEPKVIYDIGACVLHWTNEAKQVWPDSTYVCFEGTEKCEFLYKENNVLYNIGLLGDSEREVEYYENEMDPAGNSYYKENEEINPQAPLYYNDSNKKIKTLTRLDNVVAVKNLPLPDMIKLDVQGSELDVLKGASNTLKYCKDLILEIQKVEYNKGAPIGEDVINYCKFLGFELVTPLFCDNGPDGDYHFKRI